VVPPKGGTPGGMSCPPYPLQWLELAREEGTGLAPEIALDSTSVELRCLRFE